MNMTNETAVLDEVLNATSLMHLEGADGKKPNRVFLMYARKVHPDMFQDEDLKAKAEQAMAHLTVLKEQGEGKVSGPNASKPRANQNVVRTKKHTYELKHIFHKNDTFTKYNTTYDDGHKEALLSILNSPQDYRLFFPALIEDFKYREESTGNERMIIATHEAPGFRTMADILDVYPQGISGRDVAWMFRRMLVAVGNAHELGIVNGAPNFDSFMIHDAQHGMILTDWQYSVEIGQPLRAFSSKYKAYYPKYALEGEPVDDRLDLYIISKMAELLLAQDQPQQLRSFFKGCQLLKVPNAAELLREFDTLLERVYGEPKFNVFSMNK
jgi:hypothetical protein